MRLWKKPPVIETLPEQNAQPMRDAGRPQPFVRRFAAQIVMSIAASCCAAVIVNAASIKNVAVSAVGFAASAYVHLFGDVYGGKDGIFAKLERKVDDTLEKIPPVPVVGASMLPIPGMRPKTPEELRIEAEHKEAERQRKEKSEIASWLARADVVKFECGKDWPLEKYRVEVPLAEKRVKEAEELAEEHARRKSLIWRATKVGLLVESDWDYRTLKREVEAAEERVEQEAKKKPLLERADKIGLVAQPSWDYHTLKSKVMAAEAELANDAEYQARHRKWEAAMKEWDRKRKYGNKGLCVNPRCRNLLDLDGSIYDTQCQVCLAHCRKALARALYAGNPPGEEPTPPERNSSLLWKIFKQE